MNYIYRTCYFSCALFSCCQLSIICLFFFSRRRRHTRFALVTGVQTCALPIWFPISGVPVSAGYEDKWCRGIDTADPGAVPGGSTTNPRAFEGVRGFLTGPNQDRRVFKDDIFFRAE